jgi:hypothetical protein
MQKFHVTGAIILLLSKGMALSKPLLSQNVLLINPSDHFVFDFQNGIINEAEDLVFVMKFYLFIMGIIVLPIIPTKVNDHELVNILK